MTWDFGSIFENTFLDNNLSISAYLFGFFVLFLQDYLLLLGLFY